MTITSITHTTITLFFFQCFCITFISCWHSSLQPHHHSRIHHYHCSSKQLKFHYHNPAFNFGSTSKRTSKRTSSTTSLKSENNNNNNDSRQELSVFLEPKLTEERIKSLFAWVSRAFAGDDDYNNLMLAMAAIFGTNLPPQSLPLQLVQRG